MVAFRWNSVRGQVLNFVLSTKAVGVFVYSAFQVGNILVDAEYD